jgi:hypothetical protein
MHSPCFASGHRTRTIVALFWAETEIRSVQDGGELKDQNDAQRHGPRPIVNDEHYFRSTLVFAGHYLSWPLYCRSDFAATVNQWVIYDEYVKYEKSKVTVEHYSHFRKLEEGSSHNKGNVLRICSIILQFHIATERWIIGCGNPQLICGLISFTQKFNYLNVAYMLI